MLATDLSPYAALLTRAKLFPYPSLDIALEALERLSVEADRERKDRPQKRPGLGATVLPPRNAPRGTGVDSGFETPMSLVLVGGSTWGSFIISGRAFCRFPAATQFRISGGRRFRPAMFPELYEYRSLRDRLEAKVKRAFRRVPELDYALKRSCVSRSAHLFTPSMMVDAVITSPPYMRQLDYARDNRLRLWFLGIDDPRLLDRTISPRKEAFLRLMQQCFKKWKTVLKPQKYCVLVVGDGSSEVHGANLPEIYLANCDG